MEIRIEIPQYIRRVKTADSRRAVYFEWTGSTIRAQKRGLKIPRKFFKNKDFNTESNVKIEDLTDNFFIGVREKGRIVRYTKETSDLPVKYESGKQYLLCEMEEIVNSKLIPIVANLRTVGTPNMYLINGQDIFNGSIGEYRLALVMRSIKDCFRPHMTGIDVIKEYPIQISCEIHDTIRNIYGPSNDEAGFRWDIDNFILPYNKAFPDLLTELGIIRDDDRLHLPHNIHTDFVPIEEHAYRKLVYIIRKSTRPEVINNEIYKNFHNKKDTGFHKLNSKNEKIPNSIF